MTLQQATALKLEQAGFNSGGGSSSFGFGSGGGFGGDACENTDIFGNCLDEECEKDIFGNCIETETVEEP